MAGVLLGGLLGKVVMGDVLGEEVLVQKDEGFLCGLALLPPSTSVLFALSRLINRPILPLLLLPTPLPPLTHHELPQGNLFEKLSPSKLFLPDEDFIEEVVKIVLLLIENTLCYDGGFEYREESG